MTPEQRAELVERARAALDLSRQQVTQPRALELAQGVLDLAAELERVQTEWSAYEKRAAAQAGRMIDERRDAARRAKKTLDEAVVMTPEQAAVMKVALDDVRVRNAEDPRVALRDVGWMNVRDLHDAYVREVERNSEREWGIDPNEANTTPTTQGDN